MLKVLLSLQIKPDAASSGTDKGEVSGLKAAKSVALARIKNARCHRNKLLSLVLPNYSELSCVQGDHNQFLHT